MVRNIVGALLEVGVGDLPPEAVASILATRDRTQNPCAPAAPHGLVFIAGGLLTTETDHARLYSENF